MNSLEEMEARITRLEKCIVRLVSSLERTLAAMHGIHPDDNVKFRLEGPWEEFK
jgi:hypothetical protein